MLVDLERASADQLTADVTAQLERVAALRGKLAHASTSLDAVIAFGAPELAPADGATQRNFHAVLKETVRLISAGSPTQFVDFSAPVTLATAGVRPQRVYGADDVEAVVAHRRVLPDVGGPTEAGEERWRPSYLDLVSALLRAYELRYQGEKAKLFVVARLAAPGGAVS